MVLGNLGDFWWDSGFGTFGASIEGGFGDIGGILIESVRKVWFFGGDLSRNCVNS